MEPKESVIDRMYKRNVDRLDLLEKQRKLKEEVNVANEQLDYFCSVFKEKSDSIETALNNVEMLKDVDMSTYFSDVKQNLCDLQNFVATSSFFLKEYNIRKSQAVIQNLQTRMTELESVYLPKKKFGFRNKAILKKDNKTNKANMDAIDSVPLDKHKWNVVTCGFSNITNNRNLVLDREEVLKKDVTLSNLVNCIVVIKGNPGTLHMDKLSNTHVLCGPVSTSIFIDNCVDCDLAMACQQLRCHSTTNCDVYLHVTSKAIIEDCHGIMVAPYNLEYDGIEEDYATATLDLNKNNWNTLDDFNWLAADAPSPNWQVMDQKLRRSDWNFYLK